MAWATPAAHKIEGRSVSALSPVTTAKEPKTMPKNPMEMTNAEWRAELQRINREGFISRTRALDKAETEAAYDRIRKRNPGWTPTPLPTPEDPEDIEDVAPPRMWTRPYPNYANFNSNQRSKYQ
jgi:hypothetical protein